MNIQTEYIKSLLAKYYDGSSTSDEERLIREYFAQPDTAPELDTDRAVFAAIAEKTEAPAALREAVVRTIDSHAVKEIHIERRRPRYGRIAAAAAVLIVAAASILHFTDSGSREPELTPEQAREQTLMALNLLTKTVKKGCMAVETSAQTASSTIQTAENTLNKL